MKETLKITGMTCAACSARVEKSVGKIDGVEKCSVNLTTERMTVEFDPEKTNLDIIKQRELHDNEYKDSLIMYIAKNPQQVFRL